MVIQIDTDIIIDFLRVPNKESTVYFKLFINKENTAAVSFVTVIELLAGLEMEKLERRKIVEAIIDETIVLSGNKDFYNLAGEILRRNVIKFQDALIAAHAILNNLPLLTKNHKDFKKIKGIKLYSSI